MSTRLRALRSAQNPNFEAFSFADESQFQEVWKPKLSYGCVFLCDRLWRLRNDETLKVSVAVGKLMLGIATDYPEFDGIGNTSIAGTFTENGEVGKAGYITLIVAPEVRLANPDRTATNLVEATNEQLLALDSFYHLPL